MLSYHQSSAIRADFFSLRMLHKVNETSTKQTVDPKKKVEEKVEKKPTIEELQKELQEAKNRNLYLLADYENARRRFQKLGTELEKTAVSTIAKQLLPVADNIKRVLESGKKQTVASILEAISIVDSELHSVFDVFNIKRLSSKGEKFNPELQEAIATVKSKDVKSGYVVDVITEGYTISDKLLRAAKVVVAK